MAHPVLGENLERTYECPNCREIQKHNMWDYFVETKIVECNRCQSSMIGKDIVDEGPIQVPTLIGPNLSKNEIHADRKKRSTEHFKKEIMPTLSGKDQRYFNKKYGRQD